ncbi:MAG: peroxiredoxin family protein [Proteobacteria bacterium]|nr:peroxiredoxin family protein [Pseudomonadota bacterium]
MSEIKHEFDNRGIGIAAISADTIEDSQEFAEDKDIKVPLLSDPTLKVINAWGVAQQGEDIAVPAAFIVKKDKIIHWKYIGENMADLPSNEELLETASSAKE